MSTLSDRLRGARGGGTNAPKLNVEAYIDMGESNGKAAFKIYSKEKKENLFMSKPITGIFIGHAMTFEAFDKDCGANGGSWKSRVYFAKTDTVFVFEPGKDKHAFKGTVEEALAFLSKRNLIAKKKYGLYILTDRGLLCIKTNVTLGIGDYNTCEKEIDQRMVSLVPTIYDANDASIPKKTHGYLGKIAASNPPKYAKMVLSEEINEEKAISWGIFAVIDEFKAWREYKQKSGKLTEGENGVKDESIASPELPMGESQTVAQKYQQNAPPSEVDTFQDLPF